MDNTEKYLQSVKGVMLSTNVDGTEAYLKLVEAELQGQDLSVSRIRELLQDAAVVYGINDNAINHLIANPVYGVRILIAAGEPPQAGEDAAIEYLFDTKASREPTVNERGRINYKDLNYIQNAKAGQILARKKPARPGFPGKSVFGTNVPAKSGRDRALIRGANTELSADGLSLSAAIDGTIVFKPNCVSIQPSQNIPGSVDSSTGNINCLGSLKVYKNISSEFKVTVGGDLEVGGNVEDAMIETGGSVLIRGGFFGGGRGSITAKGDVTVKYVENQRIRADGSVYIAGELLNCDIYAGEEVVAHGRNGKIAGGNVAAKHLIRAATLGNEAAVATHVHVAFDMEKMARLREVVKELERLAVDEKRVKEAMVVLYRLEMDGKLPPNKKEVLNQLKQVAEGFPARRRAVEDEQQQLRLTLQESVGARIVVEEMVYAGTVIHFGSVYKEILEDIRGGTVFEKTGQTITKSPLNAERERRLAEQWKKAKQGREAVGKPSPTTVG